MEPISAFSIGQNENIRAVGHHRRGADPTNKTAQMEVGDKVSGNGRQYEASPDI